MRCLILAGGLGTRLGELSRHTPKAMIDICGKPFLHHQLSFLRDQGIEDVVLAIGHYGEQIRSYVGDGSAWGLNISFVDEGERLLGTGGALRKAVDSGLLGDIFFLTYGDVVSPVDFREVWHSFQPKLFDSLMVVYKNCDRNEPSNVILTEGNRIALYDKKPSSRPQEMQWIDYGLSLFRADAIRKEIPAGQVSDLSEFVHRLSREGRLQGFEAQKPVFEIGSHSGLETFRKSIAQPG